MPEWHALCFNNYMICFGSTCAHLFLDIHLISNLHIVSLETLSWLPFKFTERISAQFVQSLNVEPQTNWCDWSQVYSAEIVYPTYCTQVVLAAQLFCWSFQFIGHGMFEVRLPQWCKLNNCWLARPPLFLLLEMIQHSCFCPLSETSTSSSW